VALENGVGKGSGRSVPGVALGDAVIAARQAGLLSNGGGHAMAAGFTVAEDKLADLEAFLSQRIRDDLAGAPLVPHLSMDATLDCQGATPDLLTQVARLGPFGQGNSEPRFVVTPARLVKADVVGAAHVRLILTGPNGGRLKAIAFRCLDTPLGDALMNHRGAYFHLAGHLRRDTWQGAEGVQLIVEDAAPLA
jgi:single-stranded-DNA-specific exonuclease